MTSGIRMPRISFEAVLGSLEIEITGDRNTSWTRDRESGPRGFDTGWVAEEDEIIGVAITDLGTGKPVPLALVAGRVDVLIDAYLQATPPDRDADV